MYTDPLRTHPFASPGLYLYNLFHSRATSFFTLQVNLHFYLRTEKNNVIFRHCNSTFSGPTCPTSVSFGWDHLLSSSHSCLPDAPLVNSCTGLESFHRISWYSRRPIDRGHLGPGGHYGSKRGEIETLNYTLSHERGSERSERASE